LNDTPRQATVKTVTKCTLVYLTQDVFKRMVNREKIEKEITQKYKQKKNIMNRRRPD
jgi:CRP-like cAMP-binding protein